MLWREVSETRSIGLKKIDADDALRGEGKRGKFHVYYILNAVVYISMDYYY